jgi:hypothetical protein
MRGLDASLLRSLVHELKMPILAFPICNRKSIQSDIAGDRSAI